MTNDQNFTPEASPASGDNIGRLLRMAGPRPVAPHEREERVKEAVRAQWRAAVRGRRQRAWLTRGGFALAAAASLIVVFGLLNRATIAPEPLFQGPVGHLETVVGAVKRIDTAGREQPLRVGDTISGGELIDTGVIGRAAVRLASGSSLRLDHGTRLRGLTDSVVSLEAGGVYLDSGGAGTSGTVEIRTRFGSVHDIGTQFEVRLDDEEIRVRVREGAINIDRDGQLYDAGVGMELTVDASGEWSRRSVPVFGPEWDWILAVAPVFELEGRTLDVFLSWVSRETGIQPRFVDAEDAEGAPQVVLHGSIEGMRPDQALDAVLPTCGLAHRLDGGIVVIQAEGP